MPKVSIIVPVYGVEKYIERCARSLFEQTLDDIEYLFIDDCTPDRSIEILQQVLEEYPQRKPQVVIHRMEQNSGQAAVRKWGMQNATGEYVIHCDSDDWVDTNMYRAMYEKAKEEDADMVLCDFVITDGVYCQNHRGGFNGSKTEYFCKLFTDFSIAPWNLVIRLVRNSIIKKHNIIYPQNNMGEDMALTVQMVYYSNKIVYLPNGYYYYFQNNTSITNQTSHRKIEELTKQWVENVRILDYFLKKRVPDMADYVIRLKFTSINNLLPIIKENGYHKMWKSLFPEVHKHIMRSNVLTINEKIKYYLIYYRQWKILDYIGVTKNRIMKQNFIPSHVTNPIDKWRWQCRNIRLKSCRKKNVNTNFSIISSNCVGAMVCHDLLVPQLSPTVNLYFEADDYIRFVSSLEHYISVELKEISNENGEYPIGVLDDVKIHFLHYPNFEVAKNKWEERVKRINWNNLFLVFVEREGCSYNHLLEFDRLPYKNKVALVHKPYPEIKCAFFFPGYEKQNEVGKITNWDGFMGKRVYDKWDYVSFLNSNNNQSNMTY